MSRRHGSEVARTPAGAVPQHPFQGPASPGPGRRIQAFSSPLFYNPRLVNLFIQSGKALHARGPARALERLPQRAFRSCVNGI